MCRASNSRYYLAYATANESWRFFWDLQNFQRLAIFDPGVAHVDIFIAVSEVVPRRESHYRDLARLCRIAESNPRLRVRQLIFKPNTGQDFSSWNRSLSAIADECSPYDCVLCVNRSAFGPLDHGWYVRFVNQLEREPGIALCGNSINFEGYVAPPGPEHTHVQTYAFLGRPHLLAPHFARLPGLLAPTRERAILDGEIALSKALLREGYGITSLAWPEHVFFKHCAHDPALPQINISFELSATPYRHWGREDYLAARAWWRRLAWLIHLKRTGHANDHWAEWCACLNALRFLGLEEEIPNSRLMAWSPEDRDSTPPEAGGDLSSRASRIGVHVHLHYHDVWPEIRARLANLPPGFGLHVTANDANAALFKSIAADFPGAAITLVPNRGRDIGPFLALLGSGAFDRYDYVCKIHSKKSLVEGEDSSFGRGYYGRAWRRRAIADLLGTPGQIRRILALFEADPAIGVVGCATLRQPNPRASAKDALGKNRERIEALLSRCAGHRVPASVDYFAGSMYWFRPHALQAVRALAIAPGDFPEEPCEADGTLAHALERVIPTAATMSGYRIADAPRGLVNGAAQPRETRRS